MIRNGTAFVQVEVLTPAAPTLNASMPVNTPAAQAASVGVSSVPAMNPPPASQPAPVTAPGAATGAAPSIPVAAAPAAAPAPTGSFYIQVGAYSRPENATGTVQRLRAAGLANVFTLAPDAHQQLQRVRIGPIASVKQFDATIERLSALGFPNARLAQD
jgi:rare lipoprotein A